MAWEIQSTCGKKGRLSKRRGGEICSRDNDFEASRSSQITLSRFELRMSTRPYALVAIRTDMVQVRGWTYGEHGSTQVRTGFCPPPLPHLSVKAAPRGESRQVCVPRTRRRGARRSKLHRLCAQKEDEEWTEEDEERLDDVRRWLVFAALSAFATIGVQIWGIRQLNEAQNLLEKIFPFLQAKKMNRNMLDPQLVEIVYRISRRVAVNDLKLLTGSDLDESMERVEAKARKFFETEKAEKDAVVLALDDVDLFNLRLYALHHVIAENTALKRLRLSFIRNVGLELYKLLRASSKELVRCEERSRSAPSDPKPVLKGIDIVLGAYRNAGFSSGYKIDFTQEAEELWRENGQANITTFVNDLVTMTATQLLAGEEYDDTAPIITTPVLLGFFDACNLKVSYEDFYIDNTYNYDPARYRPTGVVTTFDIDARGS